MGIKIFEVDPDSQPRSSDDIVGRFRSGTQLNNRPMALDNWRVTTGDPDVAAAIADTFGGDPKDWDTQTEEKLEVFTETDSVEIILDGPDAIRTSMVLWGRNSMIRSCDGVTQTDDKQSACVCPSTVKERKEAAKAGHGCEPSVQVYFRLAAAPDLGKFKFFSGSWSLAAEVGDAEAKLAAINGPARATLTLERVEYTPKGGPRKDQLVSFTKPVVKVLGPAVSA